MAEKTLKLVSSDTKDEARSVALRLAAAYREMATFYRRNLDLTEDQVFDRAQDPGDLKERRQEMLSQPPDQVSWQGLQALYAHEPEVGQEVWEYVKNEARKHHENGHMAADMLDAQHSPWDRAQFLALRNAFIEEWQPQGGLELTMIDTLTQSYSAYQFWLKQLTIWSMIESRPYKDREEQIRKQSYWVPPRLDYAQSAEHAAQMADRFNRIFLRTLRALRDLRRYGPVIVQRADQVNVANQQVNVSG